MLARSVNYRTETGYADMNLTSIEISFIPNESFGVTTEDELLDESVELYRDDETESGSLDPDSVAGSLLIALQRSRLLTFDGEQLLFKRFNYLKFRANAIQVSLNRKRPAKTKLAELARLMREATAVRDQLAEANLRLVASIAGKLAISREEFDEFFAEGNGILLYAIDKFDYGRGYRFSTYVTHAVQRHLYRLIDRRKKRAKREFAREPDLMMNEVAADAAPDAIAENEVRAAAAAVIARIDQTLDERESFIIRGRFGLDGTGTSKTYTHLGKQLGLSKERVRQLFQRATEKLREVARPFESTLALQ
ncbi:MAG: sigma-70 family RNA polymerase sigma factor [Rhodopirellula sp.]|nr:sigma-70 family RNA polymerase sigma factor [Rhodopirellula sp.]